MRTVSKPAAPRRIAAIDIGSNSLHLIVVEAHPDRRFHIIDREKEMVRLAAGTVQTHHLTEARMTSAIAVIQRFIELARGLRAAPILITATSAVREAWNRDVFLSRVERETGLRVEILPGVEEARLIALAVGEVTDLRDKRALIVDIGGGSTEFIVVADRVPEVLLSVKLGAVRLQEAFFADFRDTPPAKAAIQAAATHIRSGLARTVREIRQAGRIDTVIGTSGTILALAEAASQARGARFEGRAGNFSSFGMKLACEALSALNRHLQRTPPRDRTKIPGIDAKRADIIVPGGILLETIMRELHVGELTTCDWSLREGVILNFLGEHSPATTPKRDGAKAEPGVRERSILNVARRYEYERKHSHHTAFLAGRLFDETAHLHKLGPVERELLQYGALLHDIGYHIAHNSHHKHAMYLIRHAELPGFHTWEIAIIANLARYHRGSEPKRKHTEFTSLDPAHREAVRKLAAILRVADGLDRRHQGIVRDIQVKGRSGRLTVIALSDQSCELEVWCAKRNGQMFESVFHSELEVKARKTVPLAMSVSG